MPAPSGEALPEGSAEVSPSPGAEPSSPPEPSPVPAEGVGDGSAVPRSRSSPSRRSPAGSVGSERRSSPPVPPGRNAEPTVVPAPPPSSWPAATS
ncbi:hypothetical protein ACFQ60_34800 [Streptomyces zhihengii]